MPRLLLHITGIASFSALVCGCAKEPTACFSMDTGDTIKVKTEVEFHSCSTNTQTHNWDFGDGSRADDAGVVVKHIYLTTGNFSVTLDVHNGPKKDMTVKSLTVQP